MQRSTSTAMLRHFAANAIVTFLYTDLDWFGFISGLFSKKGA